ncbi:CBS domain-containing protein [Gelatiniphilus marinus]|uniref:CBS domain-containing protein n=1 Tax=Gelatiniphilus marinus TaxID=1759464 RepID=A0ABW5JXR6_9FLAO
MGDLNIRKLNNKKEKAHYIHHLINDIEALEMMIDKGMIEESPIRIGAEQEFCLVNKNFLPDNNAMAVLKAINDHHFTTEIGNYNLEANLDPIELKGNCFSELHTQLDKLLNKAKAVASKMGTKIILTGILPSLTLDSITEDKMTPIKRYKVLNEAVKKTRKQDFSIHIRGADELNLLHDSVMLEGCNTSFQMHLQINPKTFIDSYNWAQAISGPILSVCANSPILFGKELWSETRIALFTQSVDTRANSFLLNEKQSRVSFGNDWQTGSITDIFKDNISRFRSFISTDFMRDSLEMVQNNETPKLSALNLHNGTVYPWNRVCYGTGNGNPHLRIENRYIPSGPTTRDEIANMALWVGAMLGQPKAYKNIHEKWDFKDVKTNFFNAARYGMAAQFYWNGKYVSSLDLVQNELLPMAYRGLYSVGISPKDAEYYLGIIENRITSLNGAEWLTRNYRHLKTTHNRYEAMQILTAKLYEKQEKGYPVSTWNRLKTNTDSPFKDSRTVKHIMNTDIFSVDKNDSVELVLHIMKWKNIHHMPVIDAHRKIIGIISWTDIKDCLNNAEVLHGSVKKIMNTNIVSITENKPIEEAKRLMKTHNISCLPVIKYDKLNGLITLKDFDEC